MDRKLGLCVTSGGSAAHVLGLAKAASKAGIRVDVFLTGEGVHLTQDPRISELIDIAHVTVCEVSYVSNGYGEREVPGLADKDFVTQARNAEMVEECDRYIIL